MLNKSDFVQARQILLDAASPVGVEKVPLDESGGRILAQDLIAAECVPSFDRSPYDGYAFRSEDVRHATADSPVVLRVLEEVPAGAVPAAMVTKGTAVKVMTGAPIPAGADTVSKYEVTRYTEDTVTVFSHAHPGENIIRAGEDVKAGEILGRKGEIIDAGLAGTLAAQGITRPAVYRIPRVGILSTGSEIAESENELQHGKIRNANRYALSAALKAIGCQPVYLGLAGDSVPEICSLIRRGLCQCDAVISTGGVSVGDYDLTAEAMEHIGAEMLFRGISAKPGMACAYGVKDGKLLCGLSGSPAAAMCNFYAVAMPALRKLAGSCTPLPKEIRVTLSAGFQKKSPCTRLLRGRLCFRDGTVWMELPESQGNAVLSSSIGCNVLAVVPAGSGPLPAGTVLTGFLTGENVW